MTLQCAVCLTGGNLGVEAEVVRFGWSLCRHHAFIVNSLQFWHEVEKTRIRVAEHHD